MLLAIDIGNSNISVGLFDEKRDLKLLYSLDTDSRKTADQISIDLMNIFSLYRYDLRDVSGAIFSSVVPALTPRLREALRKMCECQIMEVGPGLKSGVRIRMDNPAQLGGELLCAIVGALQRCTPPCVVVNFDTATTLLAVDSTGALVGGSILPGPQCSLSALVRNTAQLPQVELEARPRRLLGANAADCLRSGIVFGTAAMLDGMVTQIRAALNAPDAPVVATGTKPDSVRLTCATDITYRETLILEGLYVIWKKNARK